MDVLTPPAICREHFGLGSKRSACPAEFLVELVISLLVAEPWSGSHAWGACGKGSTVGAQTGANELFWSFWW